MGFEFKIIVKLDTNDKEKIKGLIPSADNDVKFEDAIEFEEDGIYVCKYRTSKLWTGLEQVKEYLDDKKLNYNIEEL